MPLLERAWYTERLTMSDFVRVLRGVAHATGTIRLDGRHNVD